MTWKFRTAEDARQYARSISSATNKAKVRKIKGGYAVSFTAKSNPHRVTKAQKRLKARKASVERRVALSLAKFLKKVNPAMKTAGAAIQRLKGGVLKITPIKATRGRK